MYLLFSYLSLLVAVAWWMGPKKRRVGDRYVASAKGVMVARFLLELGELANLTVIGSIQPSGMWLLSFWMARSASTRWSKRMKPTPLERPATQQDRGRACVIASNVSINAKLHLLAFLTVTGNCSDF